MADASRRDELAAAHVGLVVQTARYLARRACHVQPGDLTGPGFMALLRAAELYDQAGGASFPTYARHRIRGAMLDHLRRQPSGRRATSVDAMPWPESHDGEPMSLLCPKRHQEATEARHDVEVLLGHATAKQAQAMRLVYLRGLLLREAGVLMGVTESRVSQMLRAGLERVRQRATAPRTRPLSLLVLSALARAVDDAERPRIPPGVDLDLMRHAAAALQAVVEDGSYRYGRPQTAAAVHRALGNLRIYLGAARPG